jgi:Fe/S biogenesis protein NfuA
MLTLTEVAKEQVRLAMEDEERDDLALRIAVVGKGASGYRYQMDMVGPEEKGDGDTVVDVGDFMVFVDPQSAPHLLGAVVDYQRRLSEAGFKFDNPNSPWSDPKAAEVQRVIDEKINPQIASHGGFVTLIDVKGDVAYISMGGGCQGCGMADVTLKQGIQTTILEAVPAITQVLDSTDHAAGENPYFAP